MFRNAKIGDRVWSIRNCWGKIVEINSNYEYPLRVDFDNCDLTNTFTMDGKEYVDDINPTLFWDEIKYEIPEKPFDLEKGLRRLEVTKFNVETRNYFLLWDNQDGHIECDYFEYTEYPLIKYFTKQSIEDFMDNIKDKKITKEEFFKAYNKVFGGE